MPAGIASMRSMYQKNVKLLRCTLSTTIGATDHITSELNKLSMRGKYNGGDQIHTASGSGMDISYIGQSVLHTPDRNLLLNNVLHVPQAKRNLVSVHHFTTDNNAYLEFLPSHFFVKVQETKKTILKGGCQGGLYPFPSSVSASSRKYVYSAIRPSVERWHHRLGHPSISVIRQVVSSNNLPCESNKSSLESVCDACQQAKSHQLPYPKSSSVSSVPLELVFSDVWGPAPDSVGRKKYYVSFIDDFSKFTWLYLIKHKSEVFQKFQEFQTLVEHTFDRKIIAMQTDWGGEYE
ncbi:hypothetical protein U9M48_001464 [Paspalum notatum var. saurae]|uniref:Integrase catalytic domain-containing protein n=1 Tax=Paspalum notatum var. saurae TaxID=547442 RepID=A0AAQ3PGG0_PASNO